MEIGGTVAVIRKKVCLCWYVLVMLSFLPAVAQRPEVVKTYTIRDGQMYIELSRNISGAALDGFIAQYNLSGIGLKGFVQNNRADTLEKIGWRIRDHKGILIISKRLEGPDQIGSPGDRILFTEKHPTLDEMFPAVNNGVVFGYNRFKNKSPFAEKDSMVVFFLRGHTGAGEVLLAGSFTGWKNGALHMSPTDSGWIVRVKLKPGKYWYKFIIDNGWTDDTDNQLSENDGLGNINSVYYKTNVLFILGRNDNARKVYLSGSFNHWKSSELAMTRTAAGWQLPLYLANGTYTYRFVVDGNKWMTDPGNAEKAPNEFHDYNSVIRIGKPYLFNLNGYTNARQVMLAGSFNDWHNYEWPMNKAAGGWQLRYTLGGGNYEYGFIVDGKRMADPANPLTIDNHSYLVVEPNFTFRLKGHADAAKIYLSGDFDDWSPNTLAMKKEGDEWVCSVHLSAGKHLYKFIIDGNWIIDPGNPLWEQNQMGTGNSIVWMN